MAIPLAVPFLAKVLIEQLLLLGGAAWLGRRWRRHRSLILAYHNVVPDAIGRVGDHPVHLELSAFRRQLDAIARHYEVVSLAQALESPTGGRPRVAITIDDAYAGAMTLGWRELRERAMPATCFVTPGFVGGGNFWWDVLADPREGLAPELRALVLGELHGDDTEARTMARPGRPPATLPRECLVASEAELGLAASQGLRLGAHSWGHPSLTTLSDERLTEELVRPLAWLRARFPTATDPWLAYPYGAWDERVAAAAARAGYLGAVRADGGIFRPPAASPFEVPRLSVPRGVSRSGFQLRLVGLRQ